jgi:hypothetical protein
MREMSLTYPEVERLPHHEHDPTEKTAPPS